MFDIGVIFHMIGNWYHNVEPKNDNLFPSIEITISFQRQDSLPTHIHNIGRPISNN
jgi:hypothetical protein